MDEQAERPWRPPLSVNIAVAGHRPGLGTDRTAAFLQEVYEQDFAADATQLPPPAVGVAEAGSTAAVPKLVEALEKVAGEL